MNKVESFIDEKYQKALDCARESGYPTCAISKSPQHAICMVAIGDKQAKKQAECMKDNVSQNQLKNLRPIWKILIGGIILYILIKK